MKILLDECVDRRFAKDLKGHDVATVAGYGWSGMKNGELLARAATAFDAFVTVDRNLSSQQRVSNYNVAVFVLIAQTNRLADLRPLVAQLLAKLPEVRRGEIIEIGIQR